MKLFQDLGSLSKAQYEMRTVSHDMCSRLCVCFGVVTNLWITRTYQSILRVVSLVLEQLYLCSSDSGLILENKHKIG